MVDLAPGAYYARLAAEQSHAGNYGTAAVYGTTSLIDAAVGLGTLGLGARIESAVRNIVRLVPRSPPRRLAESIG